jgi:heptosyltransferase II
VSKEVRDLARSRPLLTYFSRLTAHCSLLTCHCFLLTGPRCTFLSVMLPNVLVVRFSSIGDVLLTTPLLRSIRQRHPEARLSVLTKRAFAPLLSDNPRIDRVVALDPSASLVRIAAELRAENFTHLLDLHDSMRSRLLRALVPGAWRTYPKHRIRRALLIHTKRNRYRDSRPVPERYFDAARELDVHPDGKSPEFFLGTPARDEAAAWLVAQGLSPSRPLVAIAPGAAHHTKRWPIDYWFRLLHSVVCAGMDVVIVGGPNDAELADELARDHRERAWRAAGRFGLQGTGALLEHARVLISGDTGVMHMATGVGTPVVALFGPTVRAFGFFPYGQAAEVLETALPCRPCSAMGGAVCPQGHHRCMKEITPASVFDALRRSIA